MLEARLKKLCRLSPDRNDLEVAVLADPLDQVILDVARDLVVQQMNQQSRMIHDIRLALDKLRTTLMGSANNATSRLRNSAWMPSLGRAYA